MPQDSRPQPVEWRPSQAPPQNSTEMPQASQDAQPAAAQSSSAQLPILRLPVHVLRFVAFALLIGTVPGHILLAAANKASWNMITLSIYQIVAAIIAGSLMRLVYLLFYKGSSWQRTPSSKLINAFVEAAKADSQAHPKRKRGESAELIAARERSEAAEEQARRLEERLAALEGRTAQPASATIADDTDIDEPPAAPQTTQLRPPRTRRIVSADDTAGPTSVAALVARNHAPASADAPGVRRGTTRRVTAVQPDDHTDTADAGEEMLTIHPFNATYDLVDGEEVPVDRHGNPMKRTSNPEVFIMTMSDGSKMKVRITDDPAALPQAPHSGGPRTIFPTVADADDSDDPFTGALRAGINSADRPA